MNTEKNKEKWIKTIKENLELGGRSTNTIRNYTYAITHFLNCYSNKKDISKFKERQIIDYFKKIIYIMVLKKLHIILILQQLNIFILFVLILYLMINFCLKLKLKKNYLLY